jgi:hypothetical protein
MQLYNKKTYGLTCRLLSECLWLGVSFWNITIAKDNEADVKDVRDLLGGDIEEEQKYRTQALRRSSDKAREHLDQ